VRYLLEHEERRSDWLADEVDLSCASERWLRIIYGMHQGERRLRRRHLEVCVCAHLAGELKSGDSRIVGSEEYADSREPLLPWEECIPMAAD